MSRLGPAEGGGGVRLDVADNGPGIRPEDVDRVFAPFGPEKGSATYFIRENADILQGHFIRRVRFFTFFAEYPYQPLGGNGNYRR